MKIAVASENGRTVSQHFGKATQYIILNMVDEQIISKVSRTKACSCECSAAGQCDNGCGCESERTAETSSFDRHRPMVLNILDCSVMMAGGMGWAVYEGLKSRGIKPVITDIVDIEDAVVRYLGGYSPQLTGRLH